MGNESMSPEEAAAIEASKAENAEVAGDNEALERSIADNQGADGGPVPTVDDADVAIEEAKKYNNT